MHHSVLWPSLLTGVFVFGGFFYEKYYYASFGISVSDFFSVGDYIQGSINKMFMLAGSVVLPNLIVMVIGFGLLKKTFLKKLSTDNLDKKSPSELEEMSRVVDTKMRQVRKVSFVVSLLCLAAGVYAFFSYYYSTSISRYYILLFSFSMVWTALFLIAMESKSVDKAMKRLNSDVILYVVAFLPVSLMWIYVSAKVDSSIAKIVDQKCYSIVFSTSVDIESDEFDGLVFVGANSNFHFFYNSKKEKAYVVGNDEVRLLGISQKRKYNIGERYIFIPLINRKVMTNSS